MGGCDSGVISKSAHAKPIDIDNMFDDFARVRRVPPLPSSSLAWGGN